MVSPALYAKGFLSECELGAGLHSIHLKSPDAARLGFHHQVELPGVENNY
jgi:hypothetical protein